MAPESTSSNPDDGLDRTLVTRTGDEPPSRRERRDIELIHGSRPRMASEIQGVLLTRLRGAAFLLMGAYGLFIIRAVLTLPTDDPVWGESELIYYSRFVVFAALIGCSIVLWTTDSLSLRALRRIELVVFGTTFVVAVMVQQRLLEQASVSESVRSVQTAVLGNLLMWFAIVVIYGTFIPNNWQRAAIILGLLSIVPVAGLVWARWHYMSLRELLIADYFSATVVMMVVGFATAVYGSYTIGALRREAFRARRLGQYRLTQHLGSGGMGEVYLAEHQMLKRPCAIKTISTSRDRDPKTLARFEREVRATAQLTHWNTVEIFDYGQAEDGTLYYVMEYLPGLSLQEIVQRQGPMQPARAVHLMLQVCGALDEAHSFGLIHRDLKPSNVLCTHRGGTYDIAKLLDFGLVTSVSEEVMRKDPVEGVNPGAAGSPHYMAPEVCGGATPSVQSDIYSLAALLYFMLAGKPPFSGDDAIEVMRAHMEATPLPLGQIQADVPADLQQLVMRGLAKDPSQRFANVSEFEAAIRECQCATQWSKQQAAEWWVARDTNDTVAAPTRWASSTSV